MATDHEPSGATVLVGKEPYEVTPEEPFTFGRSPECTACLDRDDRGISRVAGSVEFVGATLFVSNRSQVRPLAIVDPLGFRSVLAPARRMAVDERLSVVVEGQIRRHELVVATKPVPTTELAAPGLDAVSEVDGIATEMGGEVAYTAKDRLALVALFAGYLEGFPRHDPRPRLRRRRRPPGLAPLDADEAGRASPHPSHRRRRPRVAVGYLPGRADLASGSTVVSTHDAHAWPEVLFEGVGWVPFEPSPLERRTVPTEGAQAAEPAPEPVATAVRTEVEALERNGQDDGSPAQPPPAQERRSAAAIAAVIAVVLFVMWALVGAGLGGVVAIKEGRRRRRRQGSPAARVAGAWQEAVDRLVESGVAVKPDMTATDVVGAPGVPAPARTPLASLATIANRASFSGVAPGEGEADEAWSSAERVGMGVRVGRSTSARLRMAVSPAPLVRARQGAGAGS